jgi:hypothetical protein
MRMPIAGDEGLHLNGKISWLSERVIIEPAYDFVSSLSVKSGHVQCTAYVCFGPIADKRHAVRPTQYLHNSRLCSRSLDLAHVPVVYGGHMTIVPGDRDCIPTHFGDNAAVIGIASPINAVALLEAFRFAGVQPHLL